MMFLIRCAFWLSVVIMLVPVDPKTAAPTTADAAPIGALEAAGAAQAALQDVGGFCDRNPDTCAMGNRLATTFMLKARTGAEIVYGFLDDKLGNRPDAAAHGTLTAADLQPTWRGPDKHSKDI